MEQTSEGYINTVLIVVDDETLIGQITGALTGYGFNFITAKSVFEALSNITYKLPNIIISEIDLPGISGLDLLRRIRRGIKTRLIPFIFLSSSQDAFNRVEAYQIGADAYLVKPIVPEELRALTISKIRQLNEFYQMSVTDELTSLHNRREFIKRFSIEINNTNNERVSLGLIDVDYFKRVNDFYGHQMGDSVLMTLADILKEESSTAMFPARFGGEEFVLLFPGHSVAEARSIVDGMRDRFRNIDFKNGKGEAFHVSFSAGLAEYPTMADNLSHLLSRADHALYAAKEAGRDRTIIYNSVMARNDKFWEYLKTRKGVYLDANGADSVTKLFYLPNMLEIITRLDFEIESIGVMYISTAQIAEIEKVRGIKNYHYEIENIARMILLACQYHFPSDTYLALGNFFEYEFVVLFPSIVDFSYNVHKFNELCSEIAVDMVERLKCYNCDFSFSSDVVYYDRNNPWGLMRDIQSIKSGIRLLRQKKQCVEQVFSDFNSSLAGENCDFASLLEFGFFINSESGAKQYRYVRFREKEKGCSIPFFDVLINSCILDERTFEKFLKSIKKSLKDEIACPFLLPYISSIDIKRYVELLASELTDTEIIVLINEFQIKDISDSLSSMIHDVPEKLSFGIDNSYIGNEILNYLSLLEIKVLCFSENLTRSIHRFNERIKVINGVKVFADQVGIQVLASGIICEEEYQVLRDLKIDSFSGPHIECKAATD